MENFDISALWATLTELVTNFGLRILGAIVIFIVGRMVAGIAHGQTRKAMERAKAEPVLIGFASAMVRTLVMIFVIIAALSVVGVKTTSAVGILAAAGFAVGMALQGTLGNFASGVMIMIFKPFKIGDVIEAGGSKGKVVDVGIFTTTLCSPDNQKIIVPNGSIMGGTITNVTAYDTRRVDLVAGIGYDDNIAQAQALLEQIVGAHPKVLQDPKPTIRVVELADSSVNFVVRPWANTSDYWDVYFDLTQSIKEQFDENGISIPYPQRDVHLHQVAANG